MVDDSLLLKLYELINTSDHSLTPPQPSPHRNQMSTHILAVNTQNNRAVITPIAFAALHLASGQVCMGILLLTVLCSRKISRHATFINFCATMMIFSLSYILIFYAGELNNPQPKFSLCLCQAAMLYGAPPIASVSGFILVLNILLVLRRALFQHPSSTKFPKLTLTVMLITPYVVFLTVFAVVIIVGARRPEQITRDMYYCYIRSRSVAHIAPGISAVTMAGTIITEMIIASTLYRHWHLFRRIGGETYITVHFMVRALALTLVTLTALIISVTYLTSVGPASVGDLVLALVPMATFLIFGTQADLVRTWCFCIRKMANAPKL